MGPEIFVSDLEEHLKLLLKKNFIDYFRQVSKKPIYFAFIASFHGIFFFDDFRPLEDQKRHFMKQLTLDYSFSYLRKNRPLITLKRQHERFSQKIVKIKLLEPFIIILFYIQSIRFFICSRPSPPKERRKKKRSGKKGRKASDKQNSSSNTNEELLEGTSSDSGTATDDTVNYMEISGFPPVSEKKT